MSARELRLAPLPSDPTVRRFMDPATWDPPVEPAAGDDVIIERPARLPSNSSYHRHVLHLVVDQDTPELASVSFRGPSEAALAALGLSVVKSTDVRSAIDFDVRAHLRARAMQLDTKTRLVNGAITGHTVSVGKEWVLYGAGRVEAHGFVVDGTLFAGAFQSRFAGICDGAPMQSPVESPGKIVVINTAEARVRELYVSVFSTDLSSVAFSGSLRMVGKVTARVDKRASFASPPLEFAALASDVVPLVAVDRVTSTPLVFTCDTKTPSGSNAMLPPPPCAKAHQSATSLFFDMCSQAIAPPRCKHGQFVSGPVSGFCQCPPLQNGFGFQGQLCELPVCKR